MQHTLMGTLFCECPAAYYPVSVYTADDMHQACE